jgi:hypothetical protein
MTNGHARARPAVDRHLTMATTPNNKANDPRPQSRPQAYRPDEQHPGEAATPLLATKLWRTSGSSPTQQCSKGRSSRSSTIRVVAHAENGDRGPAAGCRPQRRPDRRNVVQDRCQSSQSSGLAEIAGGYRRGLRQPTTGRIAAQAWTSELGGSGRAETGKSPGSAPSHPSGMRPRTGARRRRAAPGHLQATHLLWRTTEPRCGDPGRRHRERDRSHRGWSHGERASSEARGQGPGAGQGVHHLDSPTERCLEDAAGGTTRRRW